MSRFSDYYITPLTKNYFNFSSRASRSEFWYFALFSFIVSVALFMADTVGGTVYHFGEMVDGESFAIGLGFLYSWLIFIPSLALAVRRLHDIGKRGWWLLIVLIPVVGFFILLYFYIKAGDKWSNRYGSSPWQTIEALEDEHYEEGAENLLMADSYKAQKSQQIVKIIGMTLLVIFVVVGGIALMMSGAIFSIGKAMIEGVNSFPIENHIEQKNGKIEIRLPLTEQYALEFKDLALCTPEENSDPFFKQVDAGEFGSTSSCINGVCRVVVALENPQQYPKSIFAYVKEDGGLCQQRRIATTTKPIVEDYEGLVEMSAELLGLLNIAEGSDYRVGASHTTRTHAWQLMGTKKVSFYYKKPRYSDALLIDNQKRATLVYDYKGSVPAEVLKPQESVEVEESPTPSTPTPTPQTLEEQKKALLEELEALKRAEKEALLEELNALRE
jgi:uncharacterized membrane protein YhaH (DUF805 family)